MFSVEKNHYLYRHVIISINTNDLHSNGIYLVVESLLRISFTTYFTQAELCQWGPKTAKISKQKPNALQFTTVTSFTIIINLLKYCYVEKHVGIYARGIR